MTLPIGERLNIAQEDIGVKYYAYEVDLSANCNKVKIQKSKVLVEFFDF